MAGLMVYFPGKTVVSPEDWAAAGIEGLLDPTVTAMQRTVDVGPDGGNGTLVWFDSHLDTRLCSPSSFRPDRQEWREAVPDGDLPKSRAWFGRLSGSPYGPVEACRNISYPGIGVELLDGETWQIPNYKQLPRRQSLDPETGEECRDVMPEHQWYCDRAAGYEKELIESDTPTEEIAARLVDVTGEFEFCVKALAKNYRLTRDVVDWFELIDDMKLLEIICASVGFDLCAEMHRLRQVQNVLG